MQNTNKHPINEFKFGEIIFKPNLQLLIVNGEIKSLQPRLVKLLSYLVINPGVTIGFDELMQHAWDGSIVSDVAVHRAISKLRQALNDDSKNPQYIETLVKKGYRLIPHVDIIEIDSDIKKIQQRPLISSLSFIFISLILVLTFLFSYFIFNPKQINVIPKFSYLTTHDGMEKGPRFSPNDNSIVYTQINGNEKLGGVIVSSNNQSEVNFKIDNQNLDFIWSVDGNYIYSTNRKENSCVLYKFVISENIHQKISDCVSKESSELEMDASPNGRFIVSSERDFFIDTISRRKLYQIDLKSGHTQVLTEPPKGQGDFSPRYSTDSSKLAFLRAINTGSKELMILDLNTKEIKQLTFDDAIISGLDWTADNQIVFVSNKEGENALWLYDFNSLKSIWLNVIIENLNSIDISNSGDKLVFQTKFRPYNIITAQLKKPVDKESIKYLTHTRKNNIFPSVSPDKKYIAYVSDKTGKHGIWLADGKAQNSKLLVENVFNQSTPTWSPDSTQLAYVSTENGQRDICLLNLNGENKCVIVSKDEELYPTWSIDGKHLYITQREVAGDQVRFLRKYHLEQNTFTEMNKIGGLELRESLNDENTAYFIDIKRSQINQLNLNTLEYHPITTDMMKGYFKSWILNNEGIYYIDVNKNLKFYNFKSQTASILNSFANIGYTSFSALNINSKESELILSLTQNSSSGDIGMIENFSELLNSIK